jgi:type I restriction enzyme S subunit
LARNWIETTIGEQATLQRGIDITQAEQRAGPVPVVSSGGVTSYHDTPAVSGPGVVLGRKGVVGSVWFVASDYWPHDTTLWVKDFHGNDRRFVFYFFKWIAPRIARMDVGSANPTLNRNHVHPIDVRWPPLDEQHAIAHILGTLDDKIELNRRLSETQERMARALFKSWFVDFDPVRAKTENRDPGLSQPIADLFPTRVLDCESGQIPDGWEAVPLRNMADVEKGLSYAGEGLVDEGGLPMINLGCFGGAGDFKFENIKRYAGEYREKHLVSSGDLVVANTDMTQNRVILGSPALVPRSETEERFLFSHHTFAVRFRPGAAEWRRYVYFALLQPSFREVAEGFATGTTVLALPRDGLLSFSVVLPPVELRDVFDRHAAQLLSRAARSRSECRTLATLRDALLPKLLSGELRVRDAERIVGRAL